MYRFYAALAAMCAAAPLWAETVTFNDHVAPILYAKCTPCHRPGEAAPFALMTYEDAVRKARPIARATETGLMPPWKAKEGGDAFVNDRRLTEAELDTIQEWILQGAVEGDPDKRPELPTFTEGWQMGQPDVIVTMTEAYTVPAEGPDVYRNFVVPVTIPPGKYMKAVEFRPTARGATHHALFSVDTDGAAMAADKKDKTPGFAAMEGRFASKGIGGWAVGGMPVPLPEGVAIPLPQQFDLVIRAHFHPTGKSESEQASIGFYLTDEPPTRTLVPVQMPIVFGALAGIDVPPGEKNYTVTDRFTLPVDATVTGISGHAHMICAEMKASATLPDGTEETLLWIDPWDFSWQEQYSFVDGVALPAGTVVTVTIRYDNSPDNPANPYSPPQRIAWGKESTDEMGSMTVLLVPDDEADAETLKHGQKEHLVASILNSEGELPGGRGGRLRNVAKRWYDKDGDGQVTGDELDALIERLGDRLDRATASSAIQ